MEWEPGKPWTHPSVQKYTLEELRWRYAEICAQNETDRVRLGHLPGSKELLDSGQERADTFLRAIEIREQA